MSVPAAFLQSRRLQLLFAKTAFHVQKTVYFINKPKKKLAKKDLFKIKIRYNSYKTGSKCITT